jgi:HEAT repeat protein
MNRKYKLVFSTLLILAATAPGPLWPKDSSFKKDLAAFQKKPRDLDLREKVIQDSLSLKSAPALPKAAAKLKADAKDAIEKSQFKDAAQSLEKASDLAPWDAATYSDLAQDQEKAGLYPEAMQSLDLYLLAAPTADNRPQVQDQLKKLDDENKRWMGDQIEHLDVDYVGNSLAARLLEMGPSAKTEVPFLAKALKNNDTDTRANAALLLGQIGPDAVSAIPALADRLDDPEERVRGNAAFALSKAGPEVVQVLPDLIYAMGDGDANVRTSVSCALGNIGPAAVKAVPALAKALKDKDPKVRADSAYALGKIGPAAKDALPTLEGMSKDSETQAQKNAAWAVQQINATAK